MNRMIRHIRGTLRELHPGYVIIEIGGLGYEVRVPLGTSVSVGEGEELSLYTHFAVREDAQALYGFTTAHDRELFELLITLPGIGPKSALGIMSQADTRLIEEAVGRGDAAYLSKLSGIGKKSAEKIVTGLKDKLGSGEGGASTGEDTDVIDALIALGYSQEEALRALRELSKETTGTKDRLRAALRFLGKK
jgi:holliday junction DNA helicase RuvA